MRFDLDRHRRRSVRLQDYDYTQANAYFVTICTQGRACFFGEVIDGAMQLNGAGEIVQRSWESLTARFPTIELDAFVVMPNHVHGIIVIAATQSLEVGNIGERGVASSGGAASSAPTDPGPSLAAIVRAFKSLSAIEVNRLLERQGQPVWQKSYYDHIIRNYTELDRIRDYIACNPLRWGLDSENPARAGAGSAGDLPVP